MQILFIIITIIFLWWFATKKNQDNLNINNNDDLRTKVNNAFKENFKYCISNGLNGYNAGMMRTLVHIYRNFFNNEPTEKSIDEEISVFFQLSKYKSGTLASQVFLEYCLYIMGSNDYLRDLLVENLNETVIQTMKNNEILYKDRIIAAYNNQMKWSALLKQTTIDLIKEKDEHSKRDEISYYDKNSNYKEFDEIMDDVEDYAEKESAQIERDITNQILEYVNKHCNGLKENQIINDLIPYTIGLFNAKYPEIELEKSEITEFVTDIIDEYFESGQHIDDLQAKVENNIFKDINLEKCIRELIGKKDGKLLENDVAELTNLNCNDKNIKSIEGIQKLKLLECLILDNHNIRDLSPLVGLKKLTLLNLSANKITDFTPLAELKNLKCLYLRSEQITDLLFLSGLINLKILNLSLNQSTDISPLTELKKLKKLTSLSLNSSKIIDITPLAELTNLKKLTLWNNRITDISPLTGLIDLEELYLANNNIADISPLSELKSLIELNLMFNKITDISPLAELINLKKLILNANQIADFTPIEGLSINTITGNTIEEQN